MSAEPAASPAPEARPERAASWEGLEEPLRVDTSERHPVFLLTTRNGSSLRLSESAHRLLRLRGAGFTSEEIAAALRSRGQEISGAEVEERYRKLVERIEEIEDGPAASPLGFWFRIRLLPEALVARVADRLKVAYRPRTAVALLAALAAAVAGLFVLKPSMHWTGTEFWLGYVLLLVSVLAHEFGHASACAYFGVRPSDIGATLYLIYPALYSDVSSAWRLPRRQRVVVDLGGTYFQLLVGAFFALVWALSGLQAFWVAILMILGGAVFSLNPIFKFDGYWVIADTLGVTNLSRQPGRILGHYLRRLVRRPAAPLPWSAGTTAVLAVYSVFSFAVWGAFLWRMGPQIVATVAQLPPKVLAYASGSKEVTLSSLLMSAFMAALTAFIAWRLARSLLLAPLVAAVRRLRRRREPAPEAP